MDLDNEKQQIIDCEGNVLVTANPGTGKTFLLACKYVDLIQKGLKSEEILCLTFTNKAKSEMEGGIIEMLKKEGIEIDLAKLNVFTFHSYALDAIGEQGIISANLLRYSIYRYLKGNKVLNYGDEYLLSTIVPKMDNLLRYLKNFGILPEKIDVAASKVFLEDGKKFNKEDLEAFLEEFVKIFQDYEKKKKDRGLDYADLLIEFLNLHKIEKFKYTLVDELQDVNTIEADLVLNSTEKFMVVGDQKQAIFGFQGGSILNFEKFKNSEKFVLSANRRSTDQILDFAKEFFSSKTSNDKYKEVLSNLHSFENKKGSKPKIVEVKENLQAETAALVKELMKTETKIAVIARTNSQIMALSKEFTNQGIEHSSTHFSASIEAKQNIISFMRGIFTSQVEYVKNSMFTPFFPIPLHTAFELAGKRKLSIEDILEKAPEFKKLRESVSGTEEIHLLFKEKIIPLSITYGKEYLFAALSLQDACSEALRLLEEKTLEAFSAYLESSDLLAQESDTEQKVVLTSIHKSKGKQFDTVVYVPKKTKNTSSFQDTVVEAILKSHGINAVEELEEESLRADFVAITRAKKQLFVLTDKLSNYLNTFAETVEPSKTPSAAQEFDEVEKRAYNLFLNHEYDKAKELLEEHKPWLKDFVKKHFEGLDRVSFSALKDSPYNYFHDRILNIQKPSPALNIGSKVHNIAEKMLKGAEFQVSPEVKPFVDNVQTVIADIQKNYPDVVDAELKIDLPLSKIIETDDDIRFRGVIDGIFKKGDSFLLVDWKTDIDTNRASEHRQQLAVYQKVFSLSKNIPLANIKVAIGFVGIRNRINDGAINPELDTRQPGPTSFNTISKKLQKFLEWKNNTETFFEELKEQKVDNVLWRSLVEEYGREGDERG